MQATNWKDLKGIMLNKKNPISKGGIVYESICITFSKCQSCSDGEQTSHRCLEFGGGCSYLGGNTRECLSGDGTVLYPDYGNEYANLYIW